MALTITGSTRISLPAGVEWTFVSDDPAAISVDWGDGSASSSGDDDDAYTHSYARPGRYLVTIESDAESAPIEQYVTVGPPNALRRGPCDPWITGDDVDCSVGDNLPYTIDEITEEAVRWLYDKTGSYWTGQCRALIRPYTAPHLCSRRRWTTRGDYLDLRNYVRGPVVGVNEVVVDGTPIDPDFYRIDKQRFLVPQSNWDGDVSPLTPWPPQDMGAPLGAERTWWIDVNVGESPPPPVLRAARRLVCEIILMLGNSDDCALPDRAISATHNGVTIRMAERENGQFGVPFLDTIIEDYGRSKPGRLRDPQAPEAAVHWFPAA